MTKRISLSTSGIGRPTKHTGGVTLVDDADYEILNQWNWTLIHRERLGGGYAMRMDNGLGGKTTILMHRAILNPPPEMEIDHINGNTLDNRRSNLRLATKAQNRINRRKFKNNTSGFKGVAFNRRSGKWFASIRVQCGTVEDAARMYDRLAHIAFGEFAKTNFEK